MTDDLSPKQRSALDRAITHPELQPILFRKVDGLMWFDAFQKAGFLAPTLIPPPREIEEGQFQIPNWPITDYLVGCLKHLEDDKHLSYVNKIWTVIIESTNYAKAHGFGNYRVWWQFSKIIRKLPIELIQNEFPDVLEYWLSDKFGADLIGDELIGWTIDLMNSKDKRAFKIIKTLMSYIYEVNFIENKYGESSSKEAKHIFQSYHFRDKSADIATTAGVVLGKSFLDFLTSKMGEILEKEGNDNWSCVWRPAIEEHSQNHLREDASGVILEAIRDALAGYLSVSDSDTLNEAIDNFLHSEYQTINRIAIHSASENFKTLKSNVVEKIISSTYFHENYRHEIWHFLNRNFNSLLAKQKSQVFKIIQNEKGRHQDDPEIAKIRTAYYQSIWLSAIKEQDKQAEDLYQACIALTGEEPEHPDFSSYMTSGIVVHKSPISIEDLIEQLNNPSDMVNFLNNYDYKGHFKEPGLEGLTKIFGELVLKQPERVANELGNLVSLKPHYLHELFNAFNTLWGERDQQIEINWKKVWPNILKFSSHLFNSESFWAYSEDSSGGAFIGNRNWVVGDVARLIESGCKHTENSFTPDDIFEAKSTLEIVLAHQSGEIFELGTDAVSLAINSSRGRCIEAYLNLALYHCKNPNGEEKKSVVDRYIGVFESEFAKDETSKNQYEFITIFANHIRNFLYLSKEWSISKIPIIFDKGNQLRWLCAIQGFSYTNFPYSEVYMHLKENGDFPAILDKEQLRDRVSNRYIEFIIIGYFNKLESIDDKESLISLLLQRKITREINHLVWFIWTLKSTENRPRLLEMIHELFPRILEIIDFETKEGRSIASQLCHWAIFFDELNQTTKTWLLQISPYAHDGYNSNYLMEALATLSTRYPEESYEIWSKLLSNYVNDFPPEEIKVIFINLISSGKLGRRHAREIASKYLMHGLTRPRELLQEAEAEVPEGLNHN